MNRRTSGNQPSFSLTRRQLLRSAASVPVASMTSSLGAQPAAAHAALRKDLQGIVAGEVHVLGDPGYEAARSATWLRNIPARYPHAIVTAENAEDVQAAVKYARANGLRVAIRGGGHNWSGASLRDGSVLIDVGRFRKLDIDPIKRVAVIEPGISSAELVQAAGRHGLAFPIPHCPSVPLSGYVLNGGYGWNTQAWGTAAAHVLEMDVVTAQGELVRASADENAELFWAARGGGLSFFGIVTRFVLQLRPLPAAIRATNFSVPLKYATEVAAWANSKRDAVPFNVEFGYVAAARGGPGDAGLCLVSAAAFRDTEQDAHSDLAFVQDFPLVPQAVVAEREIPVGFADLISATGTFFPPRMNYLANTFWTSAQLQSFYPNYADMLASSPSPYAFSNCVIFPSNSSPGPREPEVTTSMQRPVLCLHYAIWSDDAQGQANLDWFKRADTAFQPVSEGHYIAETDLNLYPQAAARSYSKDAWAKMKTLRASHDPDGVFFDFVGQE